MKHLPDGYDEEHFNIRNSNRNRKQQPNRTALLQARLSDVRGY